MRISCFKTVSFTTDMNVKAVLGCGLGSYSTFENVSSLFKVLLGALLGLRSLLFTFSQELMPLNRWHEMERDKNILNYWLTTGMRSMWEPKRSDKVVLWKFYHWWPWTLCYQAATLHLFGRRERVQSTPLG